MASGPPGAELPPLPLPFNPRRDAIYPRG